MAKMSSRSPWRISRGASRNSRVDGQALDDRGGRRRRDRERHAESRLHAGANRPAVCSIPLVTTMSGRLECHQRVDALGHASPGSAWPGTAPRSTR